MKTVKHTFALSRRDFFRCALGAGGLLATSSLPALADDPALFPKRGSFERLALSYIHINAGAEKPFSLLHISDTHLTEALPEEGKTKQELKRVRSQTFGGRQEEALRDSLAWAKNNTDFVLHTGDLIDWMSEGNMALAKKYLGEGVFGSMGNHEFSPDMWLSHYTEDEPGKAVNAPKLKEAYPYDIRFSSKVVNGVNFIALDDVFGTIAPDLVERFRAEVQRKLPIILCMHVPFATPTIMRADYKYWHGAGKTFQSAAIPAPWGDYKRQQADPVTRDFIAYLKTEPLLKGILAGHLHITIQDRFSPTAMEYVVGGNFMFHGQEVTVS
ncbi:MAG: metallophosphoesterase [Kiritimatiellae bacterium]|nr:metallophosphoesterase [Kiritimatiellia bacterium]